MKEVAGFKLGSFVPQLGSFESKILQGSIKANKILPTKSDKPIRMTTKIDFSSKLSETFETVWFWFIEMKIVALA